MTRIGWSGTFDAAHFIPGHPKCGRLHGHTYRVRVVLQGGVPKSGAAFVLDFGLIAAAVSALDHRLLVATKHPHLDADCGTSSKDRIIVTWPDGTVNLRTEAVCLLPIRETSTELLSQWLAAQLLAQGGSLRRVRVRLSETAKTWAYGEARR